MSVDISLQLSLGRFPCTAPETETIKALKQRLRAEIPEIQQVNLRSFRLSLNGNYLSDESRTVAECGVKNGDVLHAVKKSSCPAAALDTEKKADEE